ncbi:MAG: hypothetical protein FJX74_18155, partial [Armatimonadetes bacterium]|nr:hypothetical protein [Armatimonadota bacterium]
MTTRDLIGVGVLLALSGIRTGPASAGPAEDVAALLDGVKEITAPGIPGALCPFGDDAFSVVVGDGGSNRQTVVAAARLGQGRIVALGHNGYFGGGGLREADTGRLMGNAVRWLAGGQEPKVAVLGLGDFLALMGEQGLNAEAIDGGDWTTKLAGHNVLVTTWAPGFSAQQVQAVSDFIRNGGGFLSGDTPWGWLQLNPGKTLAGEHGGNKLLAPAGLVWVDGMVGRTSEKGYACDGDIPELTHAGRALAAVEAYAGGTRELTKDELAQASQIVTRAAMDIPAEDMLFRPKLVALQQAHGAEAVPGPNQPLKIDNVLARLALTLQLQEIRAATPERTVAHPSAELFPGAVPADAERVTRTVSIDTRIPAWHSTGLYAAPGELVLVQAPDAAAGKGLHVRIGCHTDGLWHHGEWKRAPEISRNFPLGAPVTKAANAFGGLVYIEVPDTCALGTVQLQIANVVEAPHFVLGRTDPGEWNRSVRGRPAPWAELETRNVILTVPSEDIRTLDDPVPLLEFWTQALDSCADLAAIPQQRPRPERIVADVQISAGYMHSGYPIMTWLDAPKLAVNLPDLLGKGSWGHFHELGHNHQSGHWTFEGTGEVTENLFSLYVTDRCCELPGGHPAVDPAERDKRTRAHLAAGAPFDKWKGDPFLALYMYMQLQEAFGWEAYKRVFAEYRAAPEDQLPK